MLSHPNREDRIHLFTLDRVLAADLRERICCDPAMADYEVIGPQNGVAGQAIAEIETMAPDTVASRVLILDVRSYTLPRLQHAYNKIVGYNRQDLNHLCYTILIGDGPWDLFDAGASPDAFRPLLADRRRDYHAAAFFYDPFLHYTGDERRTKKIDGADEVPTHATRRLARELWNDDTSIEAVRRYFRAASLPPDIRKDVRARREELLAELFEQTAEEFPHHGAMHQSWSCKEGYSFQGEALRLHVYPFFFEQWVRDLMDTARRTALGGIHRSTTDHR